MASGMLGKMGNDEMTSEKLEGSEIIGGDEDERKHMLQNAWKFWFFENIKERKWEDNLRVVSPFHTVEDFWSVFNHIKSASEIRLGGSYFVFKDGIKPMWEDQANRAGGRWAIQLNKTHPARGSTLDAMWLEVLLCLIGEAFDDDGDDICGAVVDLRAKHDRISIWTANYNNKDRVMAIGKKIRDRLDPDRNIIPNITYESHESTAVKSGVHAKVIFTV